MPAALTAAPEENPPAVGWLLYDANCRFCTATARRAAPLIATRGFAILPLQTAWVREKLGLRPDEPLREMIVLTRDDRRFGGADAALHLAGRFWWGRPLTWLALVPGAKPLLRHGYAWIAVRRSCAGGACALENQPAHAHVTDWLPLLSLPAIVMAYRPRLAPWIFMLALASALYAGCKWLTWCGARRDGPSLTVRRSLGYLFGWPGMDATEFLRERTLVVRPATTEWLLALAKLAAGIALVWGVLPSVPDGSPLLAGWLGMIGLILVLHFGFFHLLSLLWRHAGVNARPLMRAPVLARSLADFWGRRWNAAFHELAHRYVYRLAVRPCGATGAMLAVFAVSGFVHDLVISLPAGAGYGLPTAYFVLQGAGLMFERSQAGRRLGLGRGARGRVFMLLVTAGPAGALFHPPFVREVIVPLLHAIHAW